MEGNKQFKSPVVPISPLGKPHRSWALSTSENQSHSPNTSLVSSDQIVMTAAMMTQQHT
jgi:hypothetical protein